MLLIYALSAIAFLLLVMAGIVWAVYRSLCAQTRQLAFLNDGLGTASAQIASALKDINAHIHTKREDDLERVRDLLAHGNKAAAVAYWTDTTASSLSDAYEVVLKVERELKREQKSLDGAAK